MRLVKHHLDTLEANTLTFLRSHLLYKQLRVDLQHTLYQAIADTDVAANSMAVIVGGLPGIVKDQLTKVGHAVLRLDNDDYKKLVKWTRELLGDEFADTLPPYPYDNYRGENIDFPAGKVFYSTTANALRPIKQGDEAILRAWGKVSRARGRIAAADARILATAQQVRQLGVELLTVDAFLQAVPHAKNIVPASWTEPPAEAPVQNLMDPDNAARLRSLILGEFA